MKQQYMRIAINCAFYQPRGGGISEYIYNVVSNLLRMDNKNDYILYVLKDHVDYARKAFNDAYIKTIPYSSSEPIKRSLFEHRFWKKEEQIEQFDLFHSPFFHAPKLYNAKLILTVHDLRFCVYPETYTFKRRVFLRYAVKKSVLHADHIITISDFTKNELINYYKLSPNKITTIHEAVNREDFYFDENNDKKIDHSIISILKGNNFLFSVGHVEPRKNFVRLAEAFKILQSEDNNTYLVIAGKKAQGYKELKKEIENNDHIIYLDFVSRETLLWLYKNATAFVFPSIYEGFGFPPLEAAALGTPSIVARSSCIPEICGDGALYFNPYEINDIASACRIILSDNRLRDELTLKAKMNLERFSWHKNAQDTLKVYSKFR